MAKSAAADTLIGTVSRMRREEIRVSVRKANGIKWLDLRIFYEAETGEMRPSQRGISLSPNEWKELRKVLAQLQRKDGWAEASPSAQP